MADITLHGPKADERPARTVFAPTELAIGTVTSVFGAPVVIYMMVRRKTQEV